MVSIWYRHPELYNLGMLLIHGNNYAKRAKLVAAKIPKNSTVLDIGCGSCLLKKYLDSSCDYEGWDLNKHFVKSAQKKGYKVLLQDCTKTKIPQKDFIVISDVLHHIYPNDSQLIRACLENACKSLIVIEPFNDPKQNSRRLYRLLRNIRKKTPLEKLIGENDGTNNPDDIYIRTQKDLIDFLNKFGKNEIEALSDELISIFKKL